MIEAFPICWPEGWPRSTSRKTSPYKVSAEVAINELLGDLRLMGARGVILSSNVAVRRDGTMYRDQAADMLKDPGVACYWDDRKGNPRVIACDVWRTPRENVRAIGLTVAALRTIERSGASHLLERAYAGFARLPAASDCWAILGLPQGSRTDDIMARYRALARQNHPDLGGSTEAMARINQAYHEALGGKAA